jgi:hypothetical protein
MVHQSVSSQVASPRDRGQSGAHPARRNHSRASVRPLSIRHTDATRADVAARPVSPAEAAQARLFERTLHVELVQLQRRLDQMAGQQRMREEINELTDRIAELHRLLRALGNRFGQTTEPAFIARRNRFIPPAASRN